MKDGLLLLVEIAEAICGLMALMLSFNRSGSSAFIFGGFAVLFAGMMQVGFALFSSVDGD